MENKQGVGEVVAAVALGIIGGMALAAILEHFATTKCPACQNQIKKGTSPCPHCNTPLQWGQA
jgi:alkyl hydroperoxide reductase subunit AhpF